jgi:hypothetical protein
MIKVGLGTNSRRESPMTDWPWVEKIEDRHGSFSFWSFLLKVLHSQSFI